MPLENVLTFRPSSAHGDSGRRLRLNRSEDPDRVQACALVRHDSLGWLDQDVTAWIPSRPSGACDRRGRRLTLIRSLRANTGRVATAADAAQAPAAASDRDPGGCPSTPATATRSVEMPARNPSLGSAGHGMPLAMGSTTSESRSAQPFSPTDCVEGSDAPRYGRRRRETTDDNQRAQV
jgi:hypothetical protein